MAEDMDILVGVKVDSSEADIQGQINRISQNAKVNADVVLGLDKKNTLQAAVNDAVNKLNRPTIRLNAELDSGALQRIVSQIKNGLSGSNLPAVDLAQTLFGGQRGVADVQRQAEQIKKATNKTAETLKGLQEITFRVTDGDTLAERLVKDFGMPQKDVDAIVKQLEKGSYKIQQARVKFAQRVVGRGKNRHLSDEELLQSVTVAGQTKDGVDAVRTLSYRGEFGGEAAYATSTALGMTLNEQGKTIKSAKKATDNQKQINKLLNDLNELQHKAFNRRQAVQGNEATKLSEAFGALRSDIELGLVDVETAKNRISGLKTVVKDVQSLQQAASKLKNVTVADKVKEVKSSVETRRQEAFRLIGSLQADELTKEAEAVRDAVREMLGAFGTAEKAGTAATSADWDKYTKAVDDYKEKVKQATQVQKDFRNEQKLSTRGSEILAGLNSAGMSAEADSLNQALQRMSATAEKVKTSTDAKDLREYGKAMSELAVEVEKAETALSKHNKDQKVFDNAKRQLQTVEKIKKDWSKAMQNPENVAWINKIQDGLNSIDADTVKRAQQELKVFQATMKATGQATETFGAKMKRLLGEFTQWFSVSQLIMKTIQGIKNMTSIVSDIDSSMTDLKKVTDETGASYERFSERAEQTAKDLKTAITDVVDATSGWSRLGYGFKESEALGKWSTIYANVGDDISSVDDATANLVATLKGFGTEGNTVVGQVERIVDMFNKVGNATSISSGKIGDSLQNSASAMKEANNTLSQSVALTVGAYDVVQEAGEVGNMWKTVGLRIRGAKTELEEMGEDTEGMAESTAKLRDYVKGMTGFDIMASANEFKSTYDIIIGIGRVWQELEDIEQAALLEKLAGKNRANALAAALNNIEEIERAYQLAEDSAGSATAEYNVYTQSVEAHAKQMEASMQAFSKSALSVDVINAGYDIGSGTLDMLTGIADVLGSIPTLATAAMTALSLVTGKGRSIVIYAPLRETPLAA